MSDERPEALLKSALEKILYFEARSEALHNDLASAKDEIERLKAELSRASQREIELRRAHAETEVELNRAHRDREELGRMNDALRAERGALIEKFIEAARIQSADVDFQDGGFDLASFIALLRSEAMGQPKAVAAAPAPKAIELPAAPPPQPPPQVAPQTMAHAERLLSEGRLEVSNSQLSALSNFRGHTEETLFGFSLRELASPEPAARARAADRLKALGQSAAAPALATALHRETDGRTLVALLGAFAEVAGREGVPVVSPHLRASDPDVRIAALKALLSLDATQGAPHLSAAMKDPDAAVRRRAALLALGLTAEAALDLGREALSDAEPEVRSVGALALGAAGGDAARALLLRALDDRDEKVRSAAARSLTRVLGENVSTLVRMEEGQRRREIRRLATLPARPAVAQVAQPPKQAAPIVVAVADKVQAKLTQLTPAPVVAEVRPVQQAVEAPVYAVATAGPARAAAAQSAIPNPQSGSGNHSARRTPPPAAAPEPPRALLNEVLTELRRSLRGLTLSDLAANAGRGAPEVERACQALLSRGEIVRRGIKYFMA